MAPGGEVLRREPAGDQRVEVAGEQDVGREMERGLRLRRGRGQREVGADAAKGGRLRGRDAFGRGEARDLPALRRVVAVAEAKEADARDGAERRRDPRPRPEAGDVDHEPRGRLRREAGRAVEDGRREVERRALRAAAQQRRALPRREAREERRGRRPAFEPRRQERRRRPPRRDPAQQRQRPLGPRLDQGPQPRARLGLGGGPAPRERGPQPQLEVAAGRLGRAPDLPERFGLSAASGPCGAGRPGGPSGGPSRGGPIGPSEA
jgi:hypothetical protein